MDTVTQSPLFDLSRIPTVRLTEHWHISKDGDPQGLWLYEQHYSCKETARKIAQFVGPGEKLVLLSGCGLALFAWRRFMENDESEPLGINCAIFRNQNPELVSSDLILEAERVAWCRWPGERLYTYVNPLKVSSEIPGWCFIAARWKRCGETKGGLLVFEKLRPTCKACDKRRRKDPTK